MEPGSLFAPRLSIVEVLRTSFYDSMPLMWSRARLWLIFAFIVAAGGIVYAVSPAPEQPQLGFASWWPRLVRVVAIFFVIGSVMRTVRPTWRWTPFESFGFPLVAVISASPVLVGELLFGSHLTIVEKLVALTPCFALAVKLGQAPWCFLLSEGENSLVESWRITGGAFWLTSLFLVLRAVAVLFPSRVEPLAEQLVINLPGAGALVFPIVLLLALFIWHFTLLSSVRWMLALRGRFVATARLAPSGV
jgi:hypothetical protein